MKMLAISFAFILCVSKFYGVSSSCTVDTDCLNGCCHSDPLYGHQCYDYQREHKPCHLPNHQIKVLLYPCGCAPGLFCNEVHINASLPAVFVQAGLLLSEHGLGMCTRNTGAIFG